MTDFATGSLWTVHYTEGHNNRTMDVLAATLEDAVAYVLTMSQQFQKDMTTGQRERSQIRLNAVNKKSATTTIHIHPDMKVKQRLVKKSD